MEIKITISKYDYEKLLRLATSLESAPETIISQFVADLICSDNSAGSDERILANKWLARSKYNF